MKTYSNEKHPDLATYLTGFILALLLTLLAFGLVIDGANFASGPIGKLLGTGKMSSQFITVGIIVLAVLQMWVHLRYFLHLSFGSPQKWNLLAVLFALFIIVIMVGGTLWIMNDLNSHMMSGSPVNGP